MRTRLWITLVFIALITAGAVWVDRPQPFALFGKTISVKEGLDLKGGTHLVYALDTSHIATSDINQAQQSVAEVIRKRVDAFGVAEPLIQEGHIGNTRTVIVDLPGVSDVNQAKELIGKTAQLTFWEESNGASDLTAPAGLQTGWKKTDLTGADLKKATVDIPTASSTTTAAQAGQPVVNLTFDSHGAQLFQDITSRNIQKPVAIVLDDQVISAPVVSETISGGSAVISGIGTIQDARQLAIELNAGALPVPISVIEEQNVGATLGTDSVRSSLVAGVIGLLIIALFMIALYRLPGTLAVAALLIYTLIAFALFKLIPVTLTLAGIGGFILSIGMAVDANILIFERMREERRAGRTVKAAIDEGFRRAWTSVRDSNISSLITAAILFYFGTGIVRGFALTLAVGILVSLFTAVTVTRTFLRLVLREEPAAVKGV